MLRQALGALISLVGLTTFSFAPWLAAPSIFLWVLVGSAALCALGANIAASHG